MTDENKVELPGLRIPMNGWFAMVVFILAILIFGLQKFTDGGVASVSAGFLGTGLEHQGDSLIFSFWTPGVDTWEKTNDKDLLVQQGKEAWYKTSEATLDQFANDITDKKGLAAQGYSRSASYGAGTTSPKVGWTWTVTFAKPADKKGIDILIKNFQAIYTKHFFRNNNIYLEIREARALRSL